MMGAKHRAVLQMKTHTDLMVKARETQWRKILAAKVAIRAWPTSVRRVEKGEAKKSI